MTESAPVITDTGPLIHLGEANALHLLDRFEHLAVPATVLAELREGGKPDGFESVAFEPRDVDVAGDPWPALDAGETAALELCRRTGGMFLTDDLDAREAALEIDIEVHGSIGVVLVAYADGTLEADAAREIIRRLQRDSTLYLSEPLVGRAIDSIDERESDSSE